MSLLIAAGFSFSGHERGCAYLNTRGGRFANVSAATGFDLADDGRGLALVDWDHDGDLDIWMGNRTGPRLRLLRNDMPGDASHFVALRLVGRQANRDGIGARVELKVGGRAPMTLIKTLRAGDGFLSQSSKWLHFGLGEATRIERLVVRWPGGEEETFEGIRADRRYRLEQGSGRAVEWSPPARSGEVVASSLETEHPTDQVRAVLPGRVPLPRLEFVTPEGETVDIEHQFHKPVLLNLWASWCRPCLAELKEFAEQQSRLRAGGIELVALSVDALGGEAADPEAARQLIKRLDFPFPHGMATEALVAKLQTVHDLLFLPRRPLPVPTSILIDGKGRLAAIYKGPVGVQQLLDDADCLPLDGPQLIDRALPFPGRWLAAPRKLHLVPIVVELVNKGFLDDAVAYSQRYEKLLAAEKDFPRVLARLGNELLARGDHEAAVAQLHRAVALKADVAAGHYNLAVALVAAGDFGQAIGAYERALQLDPKHARAHDGLGMILLKLKRIDEAIAHFRKALEIDPELAQAHVDLATALAQRGADKEAMAHLREALRIDPDQAAAHRKLGELLFARGDIDGAIEHYREAVRIDPKDALAHNNLAHAFASQRKLDEAARHYRLAIQLDPRRSDPHSNLGAVLQAQGKLDEAAAELNEALRIDPDAAKAHSNLGIVLMAQKKRDEAIVHFRRAVELMPENTTGWVNLATALAVVGKQEEAIEAIDQATRIAPDNVELQVRLGLMLVAHGDYGRGVEPLRRAVELKPDDPQVINALAWVLATCPDEKVRSPEEAVRLAERAARASGGRDAGLLDTLAAAYAAAGQFDRAVKAAAAAVKRAEADRSTGRADAMRQRLERYQKKKPYLLPAPKP